jgi:hypothetical protein
MIYISNHLNQSKTFRKLKNENTKKKKTKYFNYIKIL